MEADHCFNIYDGKKALLVAAANQEEKIQWMEDIAEAAQVNQRQNENIFVQEVKEIDNKPIVSDCSGCLRSGDDERIAEQVHELEVDIRLRGLPRQIKQ